MKKPGMSAGDALFFFGLICAVAAGGVVGVYCTWGLILVCSVILGIVAFFGITTFDGIESGLVHAFTVIASLLFMFSSWCSFWVSLAGVLRK